MLCSRAYRVSEAEDLMRQAIAIENRSNLPRRVMIASLSERLAIILLMAGKRDEAKSLLQLALAFWETHPAYDGMARQARQKLAEIG